MRMRFTIFACLLVAAVQAQDPAPTPTNTAPAPLSTACGDIINNASQIWFTAKEAYDCLRSVPFEPAVATRFIKYYNDTLQFHTTTAYLKNPPSSYQQPAIDLFRSLDEIQRKIDEGGFANQYAFEATLQKLIYAAHDSHLDLISGILAAFTFASPFNLVSASPDGIQLPKVYILDDVTDAPTSGGTWEPSAIVKINNHDVTDYLAQLAAMNAIGGLEPHADWNQLMSNPVLDVMGQYSILEGYITFYPGENMTLTLANGTILGPEPFYASYNGPENTGPLVTGGDFYNFFVLGFYPASYDPFAFQSSDPTLSATDNQTSSDTTETDLPNPTSLGHPAYPDNPVVYQPDLGSTGILTGYFLRDISTAVLSIPSFQAFDTAVQTYSDTIGEFLTKSKEAGMKKILVDLQENGGGDTFLAIDAFKQFFPSIEPFAGSRLRAHEWADVLGTTFTEFFDTQQLNESFYNALIVTNWVSTYRINAETGRNFTSWKQLFGPNLHNGDFFTTPQQYNLSSPDVNRLTSGGILVHGYNGVPTPPQPYKAEDIVILTDGLCSSTCALFMELMHHQAGVRSVVAGGRPVTGPMQAPAGSRGAQLYSIGDLDADIEVASRINVTAGDIIPSRQLDVYVSQLTINLRDQIRQGEDVPLQFLYEAADCRIFYTLQTVYNFTNLWKYATEAAWTRPELCVAGSTGYASTGAAQSTNNTNEGPATIKGNAPPNQLFDTIHLETTQPDGLPTLFGGQEYAIQKFPDFFPGQACDINNYGSCGAGGTGLICQRVSECGGDTRCVRSCSSSYDPCGSTRCHITQKSGAISSGYCRPHCGSPTKPASPSTPPLPPSKLQSTRSSSLRGGPFTGGRY